jgi:RNA polymerase sigma factor (sigma-70 family)
MTDREWLAEQFEANRPHLRAVAYRMLGSLAEAEDAVQESWFRLSRNDTAAIDNLGGWLTSVVSRICLDTLRTRTSRAEVTPDDRPETASDVTSADPEQEALLADSVGLAMLVVLDQLAPAERVAFVLHDVFAVPFEEIAPIVERTPEATRKLASRARSRVRGTDAEAVPNPERSRNVVKAFLAAARQGDLAGLIELLDPSVTLIPDAAVVAMNGQSRLFGAEAVAQRFSGGAKVARAMLLDGQPGLAWMDGRRPRVAFIFTIEGDLVKNIELVADPDRLNAMTFEPMPRD